MKLYKLYVDESGTSHPKSFAVSPYYILIGCIIDQTYQQDLKVLADQIKFKYWGRTDIVFHSAEIARNLGDFKIFSGNPKLKQEFYADLFMLLNSAKVTVTTCLFDKQSVHSKGWDEKKIVALSARSIIGDFLAVVFANHPSKGKLIFESSNGFKDQEYLAAFNYYLSPNFLRADPDYNNVRDCLTSINFVTKQNHDIETQLADLFSYAAKCKHLQDTGGVTYAQTSYEAKLIKVLEVKLIRPTATMGAAKLKYYNKINSFEIVS